MPPTARGASFRRRGSQESIIIECQKNLHYDYKAGEEDRVCPGILFFPETEGDCPDECGS